MESIVLKEKGIALKERELALKEKELALKEKGMEKRSKTITWVSLIVCGTAAIAASAYLCIKGAPWLIFITIPAWFVAYDGLTDIRRSRKVQKGCI